MSRKRAVSIENNFTRGLITEVTGLNFPENACTETFDCVFDEKGRVTRRFGFNYEANYVSLAASRSSSVVSGFTWNNVAGDGSISFRVQQVGDTIRFWNISQSQSLSSSLSASTIDLNTYAASGAVDPALNECQYAAANGYLIVTHPQCEPFYVSYDTSSTVLTGTEITVQIRDYEGLDDTYAVDERPTSTVAGLSKEHKYNLFNQGWYFNSNQALTDWDGAFTTMPSNADVWWQFKNTSDEFDTTVVVNTDPGNSPAPRGHYRLDLFSQDRSTASGVSSIAIVSLGTSRFSTTAFYAGRIFYGGISYTGYSARLHYTQIVTSPNEFGACYTANDPTAENLFDILPSDGGVINIFGAEAIIKLVPMVNALLVFATNGIWSISGSSGLAFAATDYNVSKISNITALGASSFILIDGSPCWWNAEGIYTITPPSQQRTYSGGPDFEVRSLTDTTIRAFYKDIPAKSKNLARGDYNPIEKVVRWVYNTEDVTGPDDSYEFNAVLNHNLLTDAWYPWTISNTHVKVHDCFVIRGEGGIQTQETVVDGSAVTIVNDAAATVTVFGLDRGIINPEFKYFVSSDIPASADFTFAECNSATWVDWAYFNGTGETYDSYFISGYKIHGDTQRFFQSNYVFMFLEQEENASCLMQGVWDWTTSSDEGKWSSQQQIYNSNLTNRAVNFRRLKLRGKGRSLQIKCNSVEDTPFTIIGWSLNETSNADI